MARTQRDRRQTREFFAARAVGWETRYPDDTPVYAAAVRELGLTGGGRALDAGCGTARAVPLLRAEVGPAGTVVGVDVTPQMLHEAVALGRDADATLLEAEAERLPLRDGAFDAVFAAGLVNHLADPSDGLRELARVTRAGGRLALFHPVGRAVLAARRGYELEPGDVRAQPQIGRILAAGGWELELFDDSDERYLAVAVRGR
ncbi:class I SAM-dependent methyltransferase [Actinacidiphila rubida]|uniref:Methyltransferase domain-containing protein n=1 Tax=Actinacidiphila rubida TaxID=310780 RepID=A0A1H8JSX1_9ACTN|nr:class I SAM-dependent methyltransferase [Actinacidiphila rubida]SEN83477.1 Methyltransferase domain-containing protein [Actinacidiphila rubida]